MISRCELFTDLKFIGLKGINIMANNKRDEEINKQQPNNPGGQKQGGTQQGSQSGQQQGQQKGQQSGQQVGQTGQGSAPRTKKTDTDLDEEI